MCVISTNIALRSAIRSQIVIMFEKARIKDSLQDLQLSFLNRSIIIVKIFCYIILLLGFEITLYLY